MILRKINIGWLGILSFSFFPLIVWFIVMQPLSYYFSNLYYTLTSLGELLGLVGAVMFSCTLILSTRLKIFEKFFGGMNRVYVAHHLLGSISFILLLFHPLALSIRFIPYSVHQAAFYLLPGADWSINFGIAALLLMMSLLIITFFINIPYHLWKFTHQFLGPAFLIAMIHGFYVSDSAIAQNILLRVYMFIFFTIGLLAYIYRTLLGRFLVKKYVYSVVQIKSLEDNVTQISLSPKGKKMVYTPGQFIFLRFKSAGVSNEIHPFSISSTDTDNVVTVSVKEEGDYTKNLHTLQVGDLAFIEGSFGQFSYKRSQNKKQIWIAGGIGITPFISMARSNIDPSYAIDFYYSIRTQEEAVYLETMNAIAQSNPNFHVFPFFTKTQGRLSADVIAKTSGDILHADVFVCGPPPMMHSLRAQFQKLGMKNDTIHTEEFALR